MILARVCAVVGLAGAVLVAVGSIGAWATLGPTTVSGVDGGRDGWITLVLAFLAAGFLAGIFAPKAVARVLRWFPLPFGLLILLVAVIDIVDVASTNDELTNQLTGDVFTLSVGWGLWLVLAGSIVTCVAAVAVMFAPMPVPARQAPPVPGPFVPGGQPPPGWAPQAYRPPYPQQPYPPQAYPPQSYPPQPYPPQAHPGPYPPAGPPAPAPAPPPWPTGGPSYPGPTDASAGRSD